MAIGIISGVVVATGIISGVVVAVGMISGVVVACGEFVESAAGAVSIIASVPALVVAPQAPLEVFITPPSIYIQVGEPLVRSYMVTPEAMPPPMVSDWVLTL